MSVHKSMPLTKDEVMQLVQLVDANPVVYSKATNASNNLLKDKTWAKITDLFNAVIDSDPRTPEQLRLKWENLKKSARKRSIKIMNYNLKTGDGKRYYIPPDDALDKVAAILDSNSEGSVSNDAVAEKVEEILPEAVFVEVDIPEIKNEVVTPTVTPQTIQPKFIFSATSRRGKLKRKSFITCDDIKTSVKYRNQAIAQYYNAKRKYEEEIFALKKKKLQLEILELERKQTEWK